MILSRHDSAAFPLALIREIRGKIFAKMSDSDGQ